VVVAEAARGDELGTELCEALEAGAREAGVDRLYLLTTTEFTELCPASATCLRKSL
jgi:amino-acid N-acetyltransferase